MTAPSVREALERIQSAYDELCVRFSGVHSDDAMDSILLRLHAGLKALATPPAPTPSAALRVGNTYQSRIGPVVYRGLDHYCGETTHKFEVPGNPRPYYQRPETLSTFLALLPDAAAIRAAAFEDAAKIADKEAARWSDGSSARVAACNIRAAGENAK